MAKTKLSRRLKKSRGISFIIFLILVIGLAAGVIGLQSSKLLGSKAAAAPCSHPNENKLPWLTSFQNLRGAVGLETNAAMQAVDEDTGSQDLRGGDDLSVIASDIPASFQDFTYSCDPTTYNYDASKRIAACKIRFTPRQAGTFSVTFQAKDNCGGIGTPQKLDFSILDSGGKSHYRWDFEGISNEGWYPSRSSLARPEVRDGHLNLYCNTIICGQGYLFYRRPSLDFILGNGRKTLTLNLRVTDPAQTAPPKPFVGFIQTTLNGPQNGDPALSKSDSWFHGMSDGQFHQVSVTLPWVDVINIAWFDIWFKGMPGQSQISIDWISLDADISNLAPPEILGKPPFWGNFYVETYLTVGQAARQTKTSGTIIAYDPDAGDSITVEAIGLPPGLQISCPETVDFGAPGGPFARRVECRMSGTPTTAGRFPVTWVVKDSRGLLGLPKYNSYLTVK